MNCSLNCGQGMKTSFRAGSHGVPSPKSQHGAKASTHEPQVNTEKMVIIVKVISRLFYANIFVGVGLRVGSSFLLNITLNISPEPHLQKVLSRRHSCHIVGTLTWDPV